MLHEGWINGGYFVVEPEFFDLIAGDSTLLEREPLEKACAMGEFMAYQHDGFNCMDTKRDHELQSCCGQKVHLGLLKIGLKIIHACTYRWRNRLYWRQDRGHLSRAGYTYCWCP